MTNKMPHIWNWFLNHHEIHEMTIDTKITDEIKFAYFSKATSKRDKNNDGTLKKL